MSYFVIEPYSIGGCPLEEASEHYFPFLIIKYIMLFLIVLCFGLYFFAYLVF